MHTVRGVGFVLREDELDRDAGMLLGTNVRRRLTLWYVGVFGLVLLLFICAATLLEYWQLSRQMYHAEIQDIETVEGLLAFAPDRA